MSRRSDGSPPNGSRRGKQGRAASGHTGRATAAEIRAAGAQQKDEANLLLRSLPAPSYRRLVAQLTTHDVAGSDVLWEPDTAVDWVYFPRTFVGSLLVILESSPPVESATVGREGLIGISVVLGAAHASGQAIAQIAGASLRIRASTLRKAVDADPALRRVLLRYANALQEQIAQSVACNSRHTLQERCARWLLATQDRVGRDEFLLLQSFLAAMLGVHRPRVTIVASKLQQAGLISYSRGKLAIIDRDGLEAVACECYASVKATSDRMLALAAD